MVHVWQVVVSSKCKRGIISAVAVKQSIVAMPCVHPWMLSFQLKGECFRGKKKLGLTMGFYCLPTASVNKPRMRDSPHTCALFRTMHTQNSQSQVHMLQVACIPSTHSNRRVGIIVINKMFWIFFFLQV